MNTRLRAAAALITAAAIAASISGCGDSEEAPVTRTAAQPLTSAEIAATQRSQQKVHAYCVKVGRYLAGETGPPAAADFDQASDAIDQIAALAREKPGERLPSGADLRLVLGDIAEDLEGSNCSEELVRRIDEALATTPTSP